MKTLPHDINAERAVLATILTRAQFNPGAGRKEALRARAILAPDDFYDSKHRTIYRAICALVDQGIEPDIVAVAHWLTDQGAKVEPADLGRLVG